MPLIVSMLKTIGVEVDRRSRRSGSRAARSGRRAPCWQHARAAPRRCPTSRARRRSPPSSRARPGRRRARARVGSIAEVAPIRSASSRRYGLGSETTTWRAPACRTTADRHAADRPGAGDEHVLAEHRERRARCAPRSRTGRRSRRPPRRCPASGARCSSSAARPARRTRPAAGRRARSSARRDGAVRPCSCGSGRRRRAPRR